MTRAALADSPETADTFTRVRAACSEFSRIVVDGRTLSLDEHAAAITADVVLAKRFPRHPFQKSIARAAGEEVS